MLAMPTESTNIHQRGLVDLARDRTEEADQHPDRKGQRERTVRQDQRDVRIEESEIGHELEVRNDQQRFTE
jgi:hypothetical protein